MCNVTMLTFKFHINLYLQPQLSPCILESDAGGGGVLRVC